jgi:predicted phage terminase large subunit-like protein
VRVDSDAKGLYSNTAGGFRAAMGFDARIVGERGDLIIVDDPHDPEEAESDAQREHVHDRWESSIGNRVNDLATSVRVGIAQRTHEDDWSARRIADGWVHLDFPMLFEPDRACATPLGDPDPRTIDGECLHPERFPPSVIEAERKRVGERRWATLYQGRPAPAGGAMVKQDWIQFHRSRLRPDAAATRPKGCWTGPSVVTPSSFDAVVIAADLAGGLKTEKGDYNVIVVVGRKDADFFLLECWRERADFPEVQRRMRAVVKRWPGRDVYVEQAAAGGPLVATLKREIARVIAVPATRSKPERLEAVLGLFESRNVFFDEYWSWLDGAITELTTFPASTKDDFVDALVLALTQIETKIDVVKKWRDLGGGDASRSELSWLQHAASATAGASRVGGIARMGRGHANPGAAAREAITAERMRAPTDVLPSRARANQLIEFGPRSLVPKK